jgi:protocatechuate 4,5-dioxygenase beta chain
MFKPINRWPIVYKALVGDVPQPLAAAAETEEVLAAYAAKNDAAFAALKQQLDDYQPDAILVIGDDQGSIFPTSLVPQLFIYTGDEISGGSRLSFYQEDPTENHIHLKCHSELATYLAGALTTRGIDITRGSEVLPPEEGFMKELGPHAITHPMLKLMPDYDIPVIPFFVNAYFPPCPDGHRCYQVGQAIAEALRDRPERIAIYASGGLSHDPLGPRAGWIDEKLDRWVLDRLAAGDGAALKTLFDAESDNLAGGTGEIRQWIIAAGACEAMGANATVVDYLPIHHGVTGLGYAYWSIPDA